MAGLEERDECHFALRRMPNNKKQSKKTQRKNKRRGGNAVPTTLQVLPPAFKKSYLTYHALGTITEPAASTGGIYQFRLNSVYDPDFTSVGTTAMGYNALSSLFTLFRVVRVRVVVRLSLQTTGQCVCGFLSGLNSTVTSSYHKLEAEPNAVSKLIQGNTGGGHSIAEFNRQISLPRVCGITPAQYRTDFDFAHGAGANPAKSVYLTVFMAGNSGAAQTLIYNVRLIYEVEVSQPYQSTTA